MAVDGNIDAAVVKLKAGQTADGSVSITRAPADGAYLKVSGNAYLLKAKKTTAGDATETATLTFTKNGKTATLNITVTIQAGSLSSNADLSSLVLSSGSLSPNFTADTTEYTSSVGNSVSGITVTPTKAEANATIKVNGAAVSSGQRLQEPLT